MPMSLGFDLGYSYDSPSAYGLIQWSAEGYPPLVKDAGIVQLPLNQPEMRYNYDRLDFMLERIARIKQEYINYFSDGQMLWVGYECPFVGLNADSALMLATLAGGIREIFRGSPVLAFPPKRVKKWVSGHGENDKHGVTAGVTQLFGDDQSQALFGKIEKNYRSAFYKPMTPTGKMSTGRRDLTSHIYDAIGVSYATGLVAFEHPTGVFLTKKDAERGVLPWWDAKKQTS